MTNESLQKHFESMGARVKFRSDETRARWSGAPLNSFTIDIKRDPRGEFFEIARGKDAPALELLQVKPQERHLLLYATDGQRFLCGHDERHWFVAGIAGAASTVRDAKQSLMPEVVREGAKSLPRKQANKRRNTAFMRQGEWFFVPVDLKVPEDRILKNEPLQRTAGSKPHICLELYREGGELVYIVGGQALTKAEYAKRSKADATLHKRLTRTMVRNPKVYARGYVKHEDHATLTLKGWHRVFINAEFTTSAVSFLD